MFTGYPTNYANNAEMINVKGECAIDFFPRYPIEVHGTSGLYVDNRIVICGGSPRREGIFQKATKDCYQLRKGAQSFETTPGKNN